MAAKTKTAEKAKTTEKPEVAAQAPTANLPATIPLRLGYPRSMQEYADIDQAGWRVLCDVIFPNAKTSEAIVLAVQYCKSRKLDIMKKVVHIVPMYSKALNKEIDTIWPGIAEVRITATRTGVYAGKDAAEFGPEITQTFQHIDDRNGAVVKTQEVTYPEWCRITVYKIVQGIRCAFVGPKVVWLEAYATENRYSPVPNEMWDNRRSGQLEKCTEAAALRAAFPEELGNIYVAEEMHGRVIEASLADTHYANIPGGDGTMTPPRPAKSDFSPPTSEKPAGGNDKSALQKTEAAQNGPDGRPEPPPLGDSVDETDPKQPSGHGVRRDPPPPSAKAAIEDATVIPEEDVTQEEPQPSKAFNEAQSMVAKLAEGLPGIETGDLDDYKARGKDSILKLEGLTADERDMLRGTWTGMVLNEQQTRARSRKRR